MGGGGIEIQLPLHLLCYGLSPLTGRGPGDLCTNQITTS